MEKTLKVSGMHCRSCEMLISDAVSEIDGVGKASADSKKGTVSVVVKDENTLGLVRKAIKKEGYEVIG